MRKSTCILILAITCIGALPAWAAVSLEITKPPVIGGINAGPINDPDAMQGQWFENVGVRPNEFYDNVPGDGGGTSAHLAIKGVATNVVLTAGNITSFSIAATVTNDLGTETGPWANGANSHNESLNTTEHYVGDMLNTMMTIEFALADINNQPTLWIGPYTQARPEIIAQNEDDTAWYCFNQLNEPPLNQGNYYVPAWNFGDIPLGASSNRQLDFTVAGLGLLPSDQRYQAIMQSSTNDDDILSNRTTSLKISDWVDAVGIDPGGPYNPETSLHSDASVFHNIPEPQPAMLAFFVFGVGLLSMRRRHVA